MFGNVPTDSHIQSLRDISESSLEYFTRAFFNFIVCRTIVLRDKRSVCRAEVFSYIAASRQFNLYSVRGVDGFSHTVSSRQFEKLFSIY